MRYIAPTLLLTFLFSAATAQNCPGCRYVAQVFDSVTKETVYYGRGTTADGDTQDLYMDVYQPYGDTATNRPVIVFAFGGGFVQGSKDDWYVVEVCKHFTKAGYVSVSMDYRVGITVNEIISLQFMRIFFRPMQDMRAVVQQLKADYSELGNNYKIDTNRIIIGGASAGGITALMMAHCDKPSEMAEMGNLNALDALGGFYSTSGQYPNYSWQSAATVNIAGALINADWIEPTDKPIISAHGDADQVVPYGDGALDIGVIGFDLQGSYVVDSVARTKGVCSYLYTMVGKDHPSEDLGFDYIYAVVYRLMLRMDAVLNGRSFCCPLNVDITPGDSLYYAPGDPASTLTAQVTNSSGGEQIQWCAIPCQFTSNNSSVSVTPDTSLKYITVKTYEGQCQAGDIHILYDSTYVPTALLDVEQVIGLTAYPNPAGNLLAVTAQLNSPVQQASVALYDVAGRRVLQQPVSTANNRVQVQLNTAALNAGTYLLLLKDGNKHLAARRVSIVH